MSSKSALEQIEVLQQQIETLKREAVSELAQKISEKKQELAALEEEYTALTGKNLKGEATKPARTRLSKEEKAGLPDSILAFLESKGGPQSFGDISSTLASVPASAIRSALKDKKFKMIGSKGTARYAAK